MFLITHKTSTSQVVITTARSLEGSGIALERQRSRCGLKRQYKRNATKQQWGERPVLGCSHMPMSMTRAWFVADLMQALASFLYIPCHGAHARNRLPIAIHAVDWLRKLSLTILIMFSLLSSPLYVTSFISFLVGGQ
ncbi:hypothetical protein F4808DRAFT_428865 [Astrocystis sublimbata]|nr:hypothetical protein F4808DRAFT_428865 [Astrocystis sublimbata]